MKCQIEKFANLFSLYSEELGINLTQSQGRFEWFLASIGPTTAQIFLEGCGGTGNRMSSINNS